MPKSTKSQQFHTDRAYPIGFSLLLMGVHKLDGFHTPVPEIVKITDLPTKKRSDI